VSSCVVSFMLNSIVVIFLVVYILRIELFALITLCRKPLDSGSFIGVMPVPRSFQLVTILNSLAQRVRILDLSF